MLAMKVAVVLGIAILLPLTAFYGANLIIPPPDWDSFNSANYDQKIQNAKTPDEKKKIQQEQERRQNALNAADKRHDRIVFYVAYPIGLLALLIGGMFPLRTDSLGLMYGGIATLAVGCYSCWDKMDRWMRFDSLIIALIVLLIIGYWKCRAPSRPSNEINPACGCGGRG